MKNYNGSDFIVLALQLTFLAVAAYELQERDWFNVYLPVQAFLIGMIPYYVERRYGIFTPVLLRVGIVTLLMCTIVLGEMADFYNQYEWWDLVMHGSANAGLALIAFMFLHHYINVHRLRVNAFIGTVLAFSLAMTLACFWEIYEFTIDAHFETDHPMQPSNEDTMEDLIAALVGTSLVSFGGYRYLRYRKGGPIGAILEEEARENRALDQA